LSALILNISPSAIVFEVSNAPTNNTLPPDPIKSKDVPEATVDIKTCVITSGVPSVDGSYSILLVFLID